MARNASGTYTLPSGNPVVSGTLIDATWANNTLSDLGNEMTDSLSRSGEGAMLAPLRITDGVQATPSLAFSNEPSSGLYRAGSNEWWAVAAGVQNLRFTNTGLTTRAAAGAVGTPSIAAFNDTDTGIYFPGANELAIATGGAARMTFDSAGAVAVPGTFTLSGGTANGVLYLNGSKVATSGSALTFDGTNFGVGTASPGQKLDVLVAPAAASAAGMQVRTASISAQLAITGSTYTNYGVGPNTVWLFSDTNNLALGPYGGTGSVQFVTGGSLRATLDQSGNLGLGVTPSAWGGGLNGTGLQVGAYTSITSANAFGAGYGFNFYYDGTNYRYVASNFASLIEQSGGAFRFKTAASGTAGNVISFSDPKMVLDASGRLGIGTPSPSEILEVRASVGATASPNYFVGLKMNNQADGGTRILATNAATSNLAAIDLTIQASGSGTDDGIIAFHTSVNGVMAERARIDSSGNLLLGGTSTAQLDGAFGQLIGSSSKTTAAIALETQYGAYMMYTDSTDSLIFWDSGDNTERGRFTAGGYFKASNAGTYFGSTSSYHELRSTGAAGDWNTVVTTTTATGANAYGIRIAYTGSAPNGTGNAFLSCDDNASGGTTRATIRSNGGLANFQANDVNLSDERTKKDIAPLGSMWDKIKALEIVTFKYKDQTHDDDNIGLIAQQVESVAPEFVDVDGWGETPEDGVPLKSIYTADMYHAAIKALQEAMARIESLEADVAALKGAK